MALFNIYLSSTSTERSNIRELIRQDRASLGKFKQFNRMFSDAFSNKQFTMFWRGGKKTFVDGEPFRPVYVLGPLGADIRLSKIMECEACAQKSLNHYIEPEKLYELTVKGPYATDSKRALELYLYGHGHKEAISENLRHALDHTYKNMEKCTTDFTKLTELCKKGRRIFSGKKNRKVHEEEEITKEIVNNTILKEVPLIGAGVKEEKPINTTPEQLAIMVRTPEEILLEEKLEEIPIDNEGLSDSDNIE